ncbi:MAG: hypothetical protein JXB49_19025 [Bacteroidales bacterium]|nr:hypothetical protein [Bacteroidales bacterium]
MSDNFVFAGFECKTNCPSCGNTVIVNGPVKKTLCKSCQSTVNLSDNFWFNVFDDIPKSLQEMGQNEVAPKQVWTASYQLMMRFGNLLPACPSCKTPYTKYPDQLTETTTSFACTECGTPGTISLPSNWLKSVAHGIVVLVNAATSEVGEEEESAIKPVIFSCPACSSALKVDGTHRTVDCNYCNSSVYLPDDLWLRMHPVKTVKFWYAGFSV